jgi:hypothetical protein
MPYLTPEESNINTSELNSLSYDYIMATKSILWGKCALGLLAATGGITFLFASSLSDKSEFNTAINLGAIFLIVLYGGLLAWSFKDRFLPFAIGLAIFSLDWIIAILQHPSFPIAGVVYKFAIIFYLYRATKSGWELRKTMKRANELNITEQVLINHL